MEIIETATTEKFVRTSVRWIGDTIRQATQNGKTAVIGLSGGSTPQPVYQALARDASILWHRVRFFLVDERAVPPDHRDSNQRMIRSTLLVGAAAGCELIAPDMSLSLPACIDAYEGLLQGLNHRRSRAPWLKPDLVILGMGHDGHIASLFPPLEPEAFGPKDVIHTTTARFDVRDRISVTLPLLERSAKRLFLITGQEKGALLQKMQGDSQDVMLHPAVALFDERTTWMVGP
jgi:6-phosphogluconolactonase